MAMKQLAPIGLARSESIRRAGRALRDPLLEGGDQLFVAVGRGRPRLPVRLCAGIERPVDERLVFYVLQQLRRPPIAVRAVSGRVKSEGDSRIEGNLIDDLRRLEAARDGSVVFGFTQEGDFGGH